MNIIIEIITFGAAFMLGLLFFTIQSNNKGNIYLGLFLWNLAYFLSEAVLSIIYNKKKYLYFDATSFILVFLFLYLITTINKPFKKWYLLLFIPGIIQNTANLSLDLNVDEPSDFIKIFYFFQLILIIYFFRILRNHRIKLNNYYSNVELKTLYWLKNLVILVVSLHVVLILIELIFVENEISKTISTTILALIQFGMVYWIGYNGFSQSEVFKGGFFYNVKSEDIKDLNPLNLEVTKKEFESLKERIIDQRLYAKQNFSLKDLAVSTNMKEKNISSLIKSHSGTTFYHFINGFRIEEFKKTLNSSKSKQLSVFGLAQDVGFTSKSTFYAAFRAVEGMTPKEYESTLKGFE